MAPSVSVLTIVRGRRSHLENVIRGVARQTVRPVEMVIAVMGDATYDDLPDAGVPVRQVLVPGDELPLAAARNAAAAAATGEVLFFTDVDCIPAATAVADYAAVVRPGEGLFMGEVMYLPAGATDAGVDDARFEGVAVRHSDRQGPPKDGLRACEDHRCFWSLNFAIHREDWARAGGFDERYVGYGGEDTDFGKGLSEAGIPIWWTKGARVWHQYHPHHMPPVHHIRSVMRNAEIFRDKWGYRTMEHWLWCFQMMGLVENRSDGLHLVREPGEAEFELSRQQGHMPYANTRRVLDLLEAERRDIADGKARTDEVERAQAAMLSAAE